MFQGSCPIPAAPKRLFNRAASTLYADLCTGTLGQNPRQILLPKVRFGNMFSELIYVLQLGLVTEQNVMVAFHRISSGSAPHAFQVLPELRRKIGCTARVYFCVA
jgi:hypothetical protein